MKFRQVIASGHASTDERFRLVTSNFGEVDRQLDLFEEKISLIDKRTPINRDTVFPEPTTYPSFFIQNRQALAQGDRVYISLQKSTGSWAWFLLLKAT